MHQHFPAERQNVVALRRQAIAREAAFSQLDAVIDRWTATEQIVGTVVLVARRGKVICRRAAGYADREAGVPVTFDTQFRLASSTKAIVSAAALAMIEDGKLSLEDNVSDWLPYFTPRLEDGRQPEITVRHLMTHTAGLSYVFLEPEGNVYQTASIDQGLSPGGKTLRQALGELAGVPLFYEPGTEWRYSLATDVLGAVIASASGATLPEVVERYVTGPLGMDSTVFRVEDRRRLAAQYRDGDPRAVRMREDVDCVPFEMPVPVSPATAYDPEAYPSGGGGMSGTAADYLRFLEVLRKGGGPILSPESVAGLTTHCIGNLRAWTEGEGWGFGLGVAVLLDPQAAQTPQQPGTWQWGGVLGNHWFVDPAKDLSVVVMTNTSVAGVMGAFPNAVRDAIYLGLQGLHHPA